MGQASIDFFTMYMYFIRFTARSRRGNEREITLVVLGLVVGISVFVLLLVGFVRQVSRPLASGDHLQNDPIEDRFVFLNDFLVFETLFYFTFLGLSSLCRYDITCL